MSQKEILTDTIKKLICHEHEIIRQKSIAATTEKSKKEFLIWFHKKATQSHHYNEEELIFKKMLFKPQLKEGGPYCVMYFDEHINHRPFDEFTQMTGKQITWSDRYKVFRAQQSPIDIPLEDHLFLDQITQYMLTETLNTDRFNEVYFRFLLRLDKHQSKEERCFLHLCERLLHDSDCDDILSKWVPIESTD